MLPAAQNNFEAERSIGGGGPGPAGGGGGGSAGSGGAAGQRVQYVRLKSTMPDAAAVVAPTPKPVELPRQIPSVVPKAATPQPSSVPLVPATGSAGTGTGSGTAGTAGAGPGSGGGIGSGTGTGTGSGSGPGTGGGPGTNYPPTPTQFFLPPLPAPAALRGYHLIAFFDVDEKGSARLLGFNPSRDGGYNRKLRDVLLALRFRPGVRPDGTPVRDTVDIQFIF